MEGKLGVTLAQSQHEAMTQALASKVMVITGGPGVGKTTIVKSILQIVTAKGVGIALGAPTGRDPRRQLHLCIAHSYLTSRRPSSEAAVREHRAGCEDHPSTA